MSTTIEMVRRLQLGGIRDGGFDDAADATTGARHTQRGTSVRDGRAGFRAV